MDELNVTPQPEGDNPQGDAVNPQENQPTTPPSDQGSFSLNENQENTPVPEPVQPEGGVLETAQPEAMPEQNNPAQMETQPEAMAEESTDEENPTVLEQADSENKKGLPKPVLIGLGVLAVVAVVGAVVYFTNPSLFQGQLQINEGQELQSAAEEYCQDGYYWPGSQQNDILQQAGEQTLSQSNDNNQQSLQLLNSIPSASAQSLLDVSDVQETNLTLDNSSNTINASLSDTSTNQIDRTSTNENQNATITSTQNEVDRTITTGETQNGTIESVYQEAPLSVQNEPFEAEVNYANPSIDTSSGSFSRNQCVPINLNDCRTMSLLLGDTEKYKISPEYAEILKATYDKNCGGRTTVITEDDCGENASVDPTTGECSCDEGYFKIDEEEYTVNFAAAPVTYTRPICEDCDGIRIRISTLEKRRDAAGNNEEKNALQVEIDKLEQIAEENGCNPPEEQRTCEDVQADLDQLNNSPIPPTADEIAALEAEAQELGCEEIDECGENEVRDANGDCMCDEENGYFDIFDSSNPNIRYTRICVDCEGLADRIKELEDTLASSDMLDMTDAQLTIYKDNLQKEINRLKAIQEERGCNPPEEERTCRDVLAELAALDNNALPSNDPTEIAQRAALEAESTKLGCNPPETDENCEDILAKIESLEGTPPAQVTPEVSQELAELKQQAVKNQCNPPEEDPCEARLTEIESLINQGKFQDAYLKQIEYLESDCRGIEGCGAKIARAVVAKSFLQQVQNDPILTAYFQGEFEKHLDDYYTDPACNDQSCDELESRLPLDQNGVLQRNSVELLGNTGRETTTNNNILSLLDTPQTLTINQNTARETTELTREVNLLSQTNLDATIDRTIENDDLLTDEEYYERYCQDEATLTVVKQVINNDGGTLGVSDFNLYIDQTSVTSGVSNTVTVGNHVVSEDAVAGYTGTITGDCDVNGNVTLAAGENKTCTIINNDVGTPGKTTLTVVKQVVNDDGGTLGVPDFTLYIDQTEVTSGATNEVTPGNHVVSEDAVASYSGTISGDCDANGNVTLAAGENKTCAIVNDDKTPAEIPEQPEIPPASPSDEPVIISETVITPSTETPTVEQPEIRPSAPEITESPEITKTGPEMYFFFFAFVASQVFYFRKKIYSLIQDR